MDLFDLFDNQIDQPIRLIDKDGQVDYYGGLVSSQEADDYFHRLLESIPWRYDQAIVQGRHITTRRKIAWHGDAPYLYTYSNTTKRALPWNNDLLALKALVEQKSGETFNACLLNLYHDGSEGMAWHSDNEQALKKRGAIASLSFGAERKFAFKHKLNQQRVSLVLKHGSLLVMKGSTQRHWLHRLAPDKAVTTARINLTFRTIVQGQHQPSDD